MALALAIFAVAPRAAAQGPTASEVRIVTPAEERVREALQSYENPPRPWAGSGENWEKHPLGGQLRYHMHRADEGTSFKVTIELNSSGRDKWGIPTRATRTGDVTVTLHISGSAYGGDSMFSIVGGKTVTIPAGQSSVDLLIEAKDDSVYRWENLNWATLSIASITKSAGDNAALNATADGKGGHRGVNIGVNDNDPEPGKHPSVIAHEIAAACNANVDGAECQTLPSTNPHVPSWYRGATAAPDGRKRDPEAEETKVIVVEPPKIVVIIDGEEQEPEQQQQEPPKEEPAEEAPAEGVPEEEPQPQKEEKQPGVPDDNSADQNPPHDPPGEPVEETQPEPEAEEKSESEKLVDKHTDSNGCIDWSAFKTELISQADDFGVDNAAAIAGAARRC